MKRVMTLVGGIIGTVFDAIYSVIMLIGLVAILDMIGGETGSATVAIVSIVEIALGVVALVLNAISISGFSCSHEKFRKKRGLIITAIVFNFLLAAFLFYTLIAGVNAITLLVAIASVAASVLFIVDLALENKRFEKLNQNKSQETSEVKEG